MEESLKFKGFFFYLCKFCFFFLYEKNICIYICYLNLFRFSKFLEMIYKIV